MTRVRCPAAVLLLLCLAVSKVVSSELLTYNINTKKWSHVLDDHFISVTINPTDLLQGKAFGLGMNSTVAILKGLSPAYIRIGSADTGKYTFKRSRYPNDVARTEDEFIITESHWTTLNDVLRSAGLDVIVCLNAGHRNGATNKWDTRNSLELISFSDGQGYNLTFQLGYEVQRSSGLSGHQYGKDLKRLRTILNAFPRYQNSKLIGPDIRYLHKRDDVEFVNDVLAEAGPVLDAVTWHPRWPQPSKMKVSDVSELGYEFPSDYIEWDKSQLGRILQRSIFKNPIWIGEPKTESTGTFAEGLLWARRLVLAAKLGVQVVMKQPTLMDISHPKPEYWIAFLHKRLLGKAVLETRAANNQTEIVVITHCTNPLFWSERSNGRSVDGAVTVYAVNMGGKEQKVYIKGAWGGKSQIMLQYLLTSGSDPDSVFSQMTYLNGEPLMMTDDGHLPDITPRVRRIDRGVVFKLPPYSVGFWVIPDARVKICQVQPAPATSPDLDNLSTGTRNGQKNIPNIRNLNQLIVDKLKNPVSESDEEFYDGRLSDFSSERDLIRESIEAPAPRATRRVREITLEDIGQELKEKIREIRDMLETNKASADKNLDPSETLRAAEERITTLTKELGTATRLSDQQEEFDRFLHQSGLNQDFGALMVNGRTGGGLPGIRRSVTNRWDPVTKAATTFDPFEAKVRRFRRSLSSPEDDYEEESTESYSSEEDNFTEVGPSWKVNYRKRLPGLHEASDEGGDNAGYSGPPALKGLEDRYRSILSHRIQDGKRKLGDLRRHKARKNDAEDVRKAGGRKPNTLANDLQEEILMKEVEVLQKTEEAMANLIKNHKKRQQTIQEIILHEISDIKEDRLLALEDLRQQKELNQEEGAGLEEEVAMKMRNVGELLHFPQKTKRSIGEGESNVNALPEEEKKSKIVKRSVDSSYESSGRRRKSRRSNRDDDDTSSERESRRSHKSRSERLERMKNFIQSRERLRDRNILRRKQGRNLRRQRPEGSEEDSNEVAGNFGNEYLGKSEDVVVKEIQKELLKKPERGEVKTVEPEAVKKEKKVEEKAEEKAATIKKEEKSVPSSSNNNIHVNNNVGGNEGRANSGQSNSDGQKVRGKSEEKSRQDTATAAPKTAVKKAKTEEQPEYVPLKIDKNRGLNVLKRISNLVESINTREKSKARKPLMDVEDLSEEFYRDSLSKITKKRHRRSHHHDGQPGESRGDGETEETGESPVRDLKELKALRKEIKLRKLLERRMRRKKLKEDTPEEENPEGKASNTRLKGRVLQKHPEEIPFETAAEAAEEKRMAAVEAPQFENAGTEADHAVVASSSQTEETATGREHLVENPQMLPGGMQTKEEIVEKDVGETVRQAKAEQNVGGEAPLPDDAELKEKRDDVEKTARPKDGEAGREQVISEEVTPYVEEIKKVSEEVAAAAATHDKKLVHDDKESMEPEKAESTADETVKDERGSGPVAETQKTEEAPKLESVQKMSSTEMPVTETATVTTYTSHTAEKVQKEPATGEPAENHNTVLILPQVEGLLFDPLVVANPPDETDYQQDEVSEESPAKEGRIVVLDQYLEEEEPPRDGLYDRVFSADGEHDYANEGVRVGSPHGGPESGPADLIEELMEGDLIKPWRGAILDTVKEPESRVHAVSSGHKRSSDDCDGEEDSSQVDHKEPPCGKFGLARESSVAELPVASRSLKRSRRGIFDRRPPTPEERIRSFKRMVHRRHSPFGYKNEIPIVGEGENFWKMAGSTVKAVFNDVIPDAYGKTKSKIENLGIAEYFKEFGKIVEQMKNLDKLFANIGQTAVRNYIKGTEDNKGDYIQVIEKRRRGRRDVDGLEREGVENVEDVRENIPRTMVPHLKEEEKEGSHGGGVATAITTPMPEATTERIAERQAATTTMRGPPIGNKIRAKGLRNYVKERPNDLIRDIFLMDSNPGIVEVTKSPPTTEPPQIVSLQPFESRYQTAPRMSSVHSKFLRREKPLREVQMTEMNKFAPWMKTTKEFINQALTTLQRQRELSEMIARESVNDLVKREIKRKVIGKRDTGEDRHVFPVYQMPFSRKREIYGHPEDALARYPGHLQPGVYIVPTEEMHNLRSEQIMKEAPATKPGMPNMVTLNIYYDKKKQEWETSKEDVIDAEKLDADFMRYYQEPMYSWNPVPPVNQVPEYLPPLQEASVDARYMPQGMHPFASEPKLHDPRLLPYSEPYHEWVPRGFPPARQPQYVYPTESHYSHARSDWQDLKHSGPEAGSVGSGGDSGWAVQFQPSKKKAGRSREPLRAVDRQHRLLPDKKRSVGSKADMGFPGLALPFWKWAAPKKQPETVDKAINLESGESSEELFAENRRRARLNESRQKEEKVEEDSEKRLGEEEDPEKEGDKTETDTSRRRRRDVAPTIVVNPNESDLIPEWYGTVQDLDNNLHEHHGELERMDRVVALPFSDQEQEARLPPVENIGSHRRRRSAGDAKSSADGPKKVLKKLTDPDSSLEVVDAKNVTNPTEEARKRTGGGSDPVSKFFKYAYSSLVQMMREMTGIV